MNPPSDVSLSEGSLVVENCIFLLKLQLIVAKVNFYSYLCRNFNNQFLI